MIKKGNVIPHDEFNTHKLKQTWASESLAMSPWVSFIPRRTVQGCFWVMWISKRRFCLSVCSNQLAFSFPGHFHVFDVRVQFVLLMWCESISEWWSGVIRSWFESRPSHHLHLYTPAITFTGKLFSLWLVSFFASLATDKPVPEVLYNTINTTQNQQYIIFSTLHNLPFHRKIITKVKRSHRKIKWSNWIIT